MRTNEFFHPDNIIPAIELVTTTMKVAGKLEATVAVKISAILIKVRIIVALRISQCRR